VNCPGGYRLGNRFFRCLGRHGSVDMRRAIAKSCNTYFYAMGHRIGYDKIAPMAKRLGLGEKFDLPLVTQNYGTVPDSEWKARKFEREQASRRAAGLDRFGHSQRIDRPGLSDPQSAAAGVMSARIASGRDVQPRLLGVHRQPAPMLGLDPSISKASAAACGKWSTATAPQAPAGCRSTESK
jgi:penicillin-binding protein 2